MTRRTDLYTSIHKTHRYALYTMAIQAGKTDYAKKELVDKLYGLLSAFKEQLRIHIVSEETFIHPLLSRRVPGGALELQAEHHEHFQRVDDLIKLLDEIKARPEGFESLRELGLEFYKALNRFISEYLVHIDKEEERIQPTLWRLCTEEELIGVVSAFMGRMQNQTLEEAEQTLRIMIPAYDSDELEALFERAEGAPEEAKNKLYELAGSMLSPEQLANVKKRAAQG